MGKKIKVGPNEWHYSNEGPDVKILDNSVLSHHGRQVRKRGEHANDIYSHPRQR